MENNKENEEIEKEINNKEEEIQSNIDNKDNIEKAEQNDTQKKANTKIELKKKDKKRKEREEQDKNLVKEILEWVACIIIALILALLVRSYIGTPTVVNQTSMYPTLKPGERLILNRWAVTMNSEIQRGDIVTFEAPSVKQVNITDVDLDNPVAKYEYEPTGVFERFSYYILEFTKISYIKRVIGLPGDYVKIQDSKVYINGEELIEDYLQPNLKYGSRGYYEDIVVPDGYLFLVGDNRNSSIDCREFGCIPIEKIESKIFIRFWPFDRLGKVNPNYEV